jgi:hypothetical protein
LRVEINAKKAKDPLLRKGPVDILDFLKELKGKEGIVGGFRKVQGRGGYLGNW